MGQEAFFAGSTGGVAGVKAGIEAKREERLAAQENEPESLPLEL